jgi:hypothetical protein
MSRAVRRTRLALTNANEKIVELKAEVEELKAVPVPAPVPAHIFAAVRRELQEAEDRIRVLESEIREYDAVEEHMWETAKLGGMFFKEDISKAYHREGNVIGGRWVDINSDDEYVIGILCYY